MTRVNAGIQPSTLHRLHLLAEWREITMVPASLTRSLTTRDPVSILRSVPGTFTLGRGHVSFFYNKLTFLKKRFNSLADELEARGYTPDRLRGYAFAGFTREWYGDWEPTPQAGAIVLARINQRKAEKPHLYA